MSFAADPTCFLCTGQPDTTRGRYVWQDKLWRLWTVTNGYVPGYSFLTPKRHIPYITDLDGAEAAALGKVLARASRALREATGADVVYLHVFGTGVAHLHIHLAPHRAGDALSDQILRGDVVLERLPNGTSVQRSADFPLVPDSEMGHVADRIASILALS